MQFAFTGALVPPIATVPDSASTLAISTVATSVDVATVEIATVLAESGTVAIGRTEVLVKANC